MSESFDSSRKLLEENDAAEASQKLPRRSVGPCYLLCAVIFALLAFPIGFYTGRGVAQGHDCPSMISGVLPRVPTVDTVKTFQQDFDFQAPPPGDGGAESIWDSLLPRGFGYVQNSERPAVKEISVISAMHQLHCLYTIRRSYYSSLAGEAVLQSFDNGVERYGHLAHCFDYLRQGIMCSADSSIEPLETADGSPGSGVPRQCGDYDELKRWAEKYRVLDAQTFILPKDQWNISADP